MQDSPRNIARSKSADFSHGIVFGACGAEIVNWHAKFDSDANLLMLGSCCTDHSGLKQIEFGVAVHLSFDELKLGGNPPDFREPLNKLKFEGCTDVL